ncbi:MAG: hypothetical protein JEZ09_07840 [Salinivirgaceae bacterium]|nr:hypothetical protein [Salinivirgaceae bacterium]
MKKIYLFLILITIYIIVNSQNVPTTISFQGKLEQNSELVNGAKSMTFSIGSWQETQTINIYNGIYTVKLGEVNPIPSTLFEENNLKLNISIDGETLSPDIILSTSPYASFSEKANNTNLLNGENPEYYLGIKTLNNISGDSERNISLVAGDNISLIIENNNIIINSTASGTGGGDITGVMVGQGLSGGGETGDITISIGNNAVTSEMIYDGTITSVDLVDNSVTGEKIADGTITSADIADTTLNNWLASSGGGSGDITSVAAGNGLIGGGNVGDVTLAIGEGMVNSTMILDGTISNIDIMDAGISLDKLSFTPGDITTVSAGSGLGGGATEGEVSLYIASGGITNYMLANNSIAGNNILDGTITSADIADTTLTNWFASVGGGSGDITSVNVGQGLTGGATVGDATISIANNSITSAMIYDGTITSVDIVDNSITGEKIVDGTITSADVADTTLANWFASGGGGSGDITSVNVGQGLTGGGEIGDVTLSIASDAITSDMILDGTIQNADINTGEISSDKLDFTPGDITGVTAGTGLTGGGTSGTPTISVAAGGISNSLLANNAVNSAKIADGSITTADLNFTPVTNPYSGTLTVDALVSGSPVAVASSGDITAQYDIMADRDINAGDDIHVGDDLFVTGDVLSDNEIQADYAIIAGVPTSAWDSEDIVASDDLIADDDVEYGGVLNSFKKSSTKADVYIYATPTLGFEVTYFVKGTAKLLNGRCNIQLPDYFANEIISNTITIQITPLSIDSKGLAVISKSAKQIEVGELFKGSGTYEFDYFIQANVAGQENYKQERSKNENDD